MLKMRLPAGALVGLIFLSMPNDVIAQRASAPPAKTVLFVCEHGTVKSLIAKLLFEEYAREVGLHMRAESRGTHADSVVPPWMMQKLAQDRVDLGSWTPRTLGASDLANASYVVSFDVPGAATAAARVERVQWDGLPSVTQNYAEGREAIKVRVRQLVDSLHRAQKAKRP